MQSDTSNQRLVFISHSGVDTWVAKLIARGVEGCGAKPFLDVDEIEVGEDFEERIRTFLNEAHELLVILTPSALRRPYIWSELGAVWSRKILIVGVLLGITATELQSDPDIPVYLKKGNLSTSTTWTVISSNSERESLARWPTMKE